MEEKIYSAISPAFSIKLFKDDGMLRGFAQVLVARKC